MTNAKIICQAIKDAKNICLDCISEEAQAQYTLEEIIFHCVNIAIYNDAKIEQKEFYKIVKNLLNFAKKYPENIDCTLIEYLINQGAIAA